MAIMMFAMTSCKGDDVTADSGKNLMKAAVMQEDGIPLSKLVTDKYPKEIMKILDGIPMNIGKEDIVSMEKIINEIDIISRMQWMGRCRSLNVIDERPGAPSASSQRLATALWNTFHGCWSRSVFALLVEYEIVDERILNDPSMDILYKYSEIMVFADK